MPLKTINNEPASNLHRLNLIYCITNVLYEIFVTENEKILERYPERLVLGQRRGKAIKALIHTRKLFSFLLSENKLQK